ncbi:hypothetical protein BYT27DRAFT_7247914 [Phlegmacium glaucopus]|nr:hypothetical protein BYT27DRAFT_7247914 [Phlegmacium glaucopus]
MLTSGSSQKELLQAFIDCIKAHEALVKNSILHHDISMSNLALVCTSRHNHGEECPPNSLRRGVLIDLYYAIWLANTSHTISKNDKMGTLPFIAIKILCPGGDQTQGHAYQHNLESFLYVLIWICITYKGPGVLKKNINSIVMSWNDQNVTQLEYLGITKRAHLQTKDVIYRGFSPYFQGFRPLIDGLMDILLTTPDYYTGKSAVTHQAFITIFENILSTLPPESAVSRPPTGTKPAVKKRIFDDEDGDLMIGSEPMIRKPSIRLKQVHIAA